jgi:hypothetical protein
MEVIVPAAGLSTRFPNMPPKYLLTDSNGDMMLQKAVEPYLNNHVIIGILQEHDENTTQRKEFMSNFLKILLTWWFYHKSRLGQATIFEIIERTKIEGNFLIKDCDSYLNIQSPQVIMCVFQK